MITSKKFLKMLSADGIELEKMIDKMSEDDLKYLVKIIFKTIKEQNINLDKPLN